MHSFKRYPRQVVIDAAKAATPAYAFGERSGGYIVTKPKWYMVVSKVLGDDGQEIDAGNVYAFADSPEAAGLLARKHIIGHWSSIELYSGYSVSMDAPTEVLESVETLCLCAGRRQGVHSVSGMKLCIGTARQCRFTVNPDHNINLVYPGVYWVLFTVYPTDQTKARIRYSLKTKDLWVARAKRDAIFAELQTEDGIGRLDAQLKLKARFPDSRVYGQARRRQGLPSFTRSRQVRHSGEYLAREKEKIATWRADRSNT